MTRARVAQRRGACGRRVATVVVSALGALLLATGVAFAYVLGTGHVSATGGHATVTTGNAPQAVTIAVNGTAGSLLQPDGTGDLVLTVTNPNSYDVQITALALQSVSGCATPAVTLTTPSSGYLPVTLPHNASAARIVLAGALTMGASSSDCQNKALTLTLVPTVRK